MKEKRKEGANKPRNVVTITITEEQRARLEKERQQRGGDNKGVKIAHVARDKFVQGLEDGDKRK